MIVVAGGGTIEFLQNRRLPGIVQAQDQQSAFAFFLLDFFEDGRQTHPDQPPGCVLCRAGRRRVRVGSGVFGQRVYA